MLYWKNAESKNAAADVAFGAIMTELASAVGQHRGLNSELEGWAVIHEESTELFDAIRAKHATKEEHKAAVREEAIQIGAMAVRFLVDLELIQSTESAQAVARSSP